MSPAENRRRRVLRHLERCGGWHTSREIAAALGMDFRRVAAALWLLEMELAVKREAIREDRRASRWRHLPPPSFPVRREAS